MATMHVEPGWTEVRCEDALDFLGVLDPIGGLFQQSLSAKYLYRGVGSAEFDLLPTAFRPGTILLHNDEFVEVPLPTTFSQCEAELGTLRRFFEIARRMVFDCLKILKFFAAF